jgi:type VI secretion system protein ImpM
VTVHGPIGFYGKIPAHGDFVRGNVADALAQRFVRWLEEAWEACHRSKGQLPREPVRFLFRAAGETRALVGVMRGSQDRVGRQFPLAVFVPAAGPAVEGTFPIAPFLYRSFGDAAAAVLAEDPPAPAALADRVAALQVPGPAEVAAAEEEARAAAARPSDELLGRLFGDAAQGRRHYAVNTFLAACVMVRAREPSRAETVLDCPATEVADAWTWLELARRGLGWAAAPPYFFRAGSPGRLLVSLGAPPPAVLPSLCEPPRDHPKIWPLHTSSSAAIESARKALGGARCAALDTGRATLGELAVELVGGR